MAKGIPGNDRVTLGTDKGYDVHDFVGELKHMNVTPHVAQNNTNRRSAIDHRATRHDGYRVSQEKVQEMRTLVMLSTVSVALGLLSLPYGLYMVLRIIICLTAVVGFHQVARGAGRQLALDLWSPHCPIQPGTASSFNAEAAVDCD